MTRKRKTTEGHEEDVPVGNVPDGNPENCPLDEHHWRTVNGITLCPACGVEQRNLPADASA